VPTRTLRGQLRAVACQTGTILLVAVIVGLAQSLAGTLVPP
jgi:FlaG/FlaF family flagellin (archaellin)